MFFSPYTGTIRDLPSKSCRKSKPGATRLLESTSRKQVGAPGFEPGTSCSQSKRAEPDCATPRNDDFYEYVKGRSVDYGTLAPQRHALTGLRYAPKLRSSRICKRPVSRLRDFGATAPRASRAAPRTSGVSIMRRMKTRQAINRITLLLALLAGLPACSPSNQPLPTSTPYPLTSTTTPTPQPTLTPTPISTSTATAIACLTQSGSRGRGTTQFDQTSTGILDLSAAVLR